MDELIRISSPLDRPAHFFVLEVLMLGATVAVLAHAIQRFRAGDRRPLFQWIALTSYGVQMELIAFNFLENYEHAQFTVQLYGGQLPLYVVGLYGSFMYAGIQLAERLRVHPVAEAFLAGFAICLIDVPFDLAGVALGWWTWLDTDPVLAFRWLGVPVTSYYWYLIFGAVAAGLCRLAWPRVEKRPFGLAVVVALVLGFLVIFFGVLGFLPFHAMAAAGLSHGTIVAMHLVGCVVLALAVRGTPGALDRLALAAGLGLPAGITLLLIVASLSGGVDEAGSRIAFSLAASLGLSALAFALPVRRPAIATPAALTTPTTR